MLHRDGEPRKTMSLVWTKEDERLSGGRIGDAGSQALWECLMVLRALWCWLEKDSQGYVRIVGDAQGVLSALLKRSAKSPLLNRVAREISLFLAKNYLAIEALHIWSEHHEWADALSRVKDPNKPARRPEEFLGLRHREDAPQYWHDEVQKIALRASSALPLVVSESCCKQEVGSHTCCKQVGSRAHLNCMVEALNAHRWEQGIAGYRKPAPLVQPRFIRTSCMPGAGMGDSRVSGLCSEL